MTIREERMVQCGMIVFVNYRLNMGMTDMRRLLTLMEGKTILNELTRPSLDEAIEILKSKGYKRIGSGYYGDVFRKDGDNRVIKLFTYHDQAFRSYAEWCLSHNSPNVPKFYGRPMRINKEFYGIKTELLTPCSYSGEVRSLIAFAEEYKSHLDRQEEDEDYNGDVSEIVAEYESRINSANPQLIETMKAIIDTFCPENDLDMGTNNVMMRGSTIVIIDPICEYEDTYDGYDDWWKA